ncbi:hypothetical protein AAFF_G00388280 [Aldrovandia affinis]|uniref:Uncharacterized protein n=1 Tax=Aldrovandia affinis TaxID=143900 RepID=A0AAD7WLC2_9TELE|nr:hypothetical protein AAFF_G00388280 [Aldrovandia affinis]
MSQQRERRIGLRWVKMRDLVSSLRRKRYLPCSIVLDAVESALSSMDLKALRNEMKVQGRLAVCHRHYSFQARHFCLTLLFYAPDAYRFAARHLRLPGPRRLGYSLRDDKFQLRVNGGSVGVDTGWDSLDEDDLDPEEAPQAEPPRTLPPAGVPAEHQNTKLPVGYALCGGLSSDDLKNLILQCVSKLHSFNIDICEVLFDKLSTNLIKGKMPKEELYDVLLDFFISHKSKNLH